MKKWRKEKLSPTILLEETMLVNGCYFCLCFYFQFSNNFQSMFLLFLYSFLIKWRERARARLFLHFNISFFGCTSHYLYAYAWANEIRKNYNNNFKKTRFQSISNSWNNSLTNRVQFLFLVSSLCFFELFDYYYFFLYSYV